MSQLVSVFWSFLRPCDYHLSFYLGMPDQHVQPSPRYPPPVQQIGHSNASSSPRYPMPQYSENRPFGATHAVSHGPMPPKNSITVPNPHPPHGPGGTITNNIPVSTKPALPQSPHPVNHQYQSYNTAPRISNLPPPPSQPRVNNHGHPSLVSPQFVPHAHSPSLGRPPPVGTVPMVTPSGHHLPPQASSGHANVPGTRHSHIHGPPPMSNYPTQAPVPQNIRPAPAWPQSQNPPGTNTLLDFLLVTRFELILCLVPVGTPRFDSWPTLGGGPGPINNNYKNRPIDLTQVNKRPIYSCVFLS